MRLATWNVNSLKARLERVEAWLAEAEPDVLCVQETKLADDAFPALTLAGLGYEAVHHGQGRWNGVAILSRIGLTDVVHGFADGGPPDAEARLVTARCGGTVVISAYAPNGRAVGHEQFDYKLAWFDRLAAHLDSVADPGDDVVLCGDLNVAPEDRDVWDVEEIHGATHITPAERARFQALLDWGLVDAFRRCYPDDDQLFTWWDYRAGNFHKHKGMRIDHVLVSESLAGRIRWSLVDRNARKGQAPSDHAPLLLEVAPPAGALGPNSPGWPERLAALTEEPPTARHAELRRMAVAARRLLHGMVMTDADEPTLTAAADTLEVLADQFDQSLNPERRTIHEGFTEASTSGNASGFFEHSPMLGVANPIAPPIVLRHVDDRTMVGEVVFDAAYEGPPGNVHGGFVAAAFDEVLGAVQSLSGQPGMTGTLTVRYRSPTPLHEPLVFTGHLDGVEGRKILTSGTLHAGDRLCAESEAIFISIDFGRMAELRKRRAEQETRRRSDDPG